ncbi:integral membrane protein [Bacillus sp. JCM 19046]|nr:integral membrane protein [Bacillus sp. JCM 19045]GAF15627.1 integral membrane protein [Bacillus sp. JCM 19046]
MKHGITLLIKLVVSLFAFSIGFLFFTEATYVDVITFALLTVIVSYVAIDLIVLPRFGNRTALVSDFVLTYFTVWVFGSVLFHNYMLIAWGSIISASVITFSEVFVHRYVLKNVSETRSRRQPRTRFAFDTEFAEEDTIDSTTKKED